MASEVSLCGATARDLTYLRPTFFIATPLRELKSLSSPLWGLLERTIDLEFTSFGKLSRIYYEVSQSMRSRNPWYYTGDSKDVKSSDGSTVNLNCPFLLSKRRRMVFEGGMSTLIWEYL